MQKLISSILVMISLIMTNTYGAIIEGNPKGNVTLTFVYDYQCPYCHAQYPIIEDLISTYPNLKVKLLPVAIIGAQSLPLAAEAIVTTKAPGLFDSFNETVFNTDPQDLDAEAILSTLPVNKAGFTKAMHGQMVYDQLQEGMSLLHRYHQKSVPLILLSTSNNNNTLIYNELTSYDNLTQAIQHIPSIEEVKK